MDGYLDGGFELLEFQEKKNVLMSEKKTLEEKLSDFERKGNHWLELVRNWILQASQAQNLASGEKFDEMKTFLKSIGSNRRISAGILGIEFKKPWNYLHKINTEIQNSDSNSLSNSLKWTLAESNRYLLGANEVF